MITSPPLNRKVGCSRPTIIRARCLRIRQHYPGHKNYPSYIIHLLCFFQACLMGSNLQLTLHFLFFQFRLTYFISSCYQYDFFCIEIACVLSFSGNFDKKYYKQLLSIRFFLHWDCMCFRSSSSCGLFWTPKLCMRPVLWAVKWVSDWSMHSSSSTASSTHSCTLSR